MCHYRFFNSLQTVKFFKKSSTKIKAPPTYYSTGSIELTVVNCFQDLIQLELKT